MGESQSSLDYLLPVSEKRVSRDKQQKQLFPRLHGRLLGLLMKGYHLQAFQSENYRKLFSDGKG